MSKTMLLSESGLKLVLPLTLLLSHGLHLCEAQGWSFQSITGGGQASSMALDRLVNEVVVTGNVFDNQLFANFQQVSSTTLHPEDKTEDERVRSPPHNVLLIPEESNNDNEDGLDIPFVQPSSFLATVTDGLNEGHHQEPIPSRSPENVVSTSLIISKQSNETTPGTAVVIGYAPTIVQDTSTKVPKSHTQSGFKIGKMHEVVMVVSLDTTSQLLHDSKPLLNTFSFDKWPVDPIFSYPMHAIRGHSSDTVYVAVQQAEYVPQIPVGDSQSLLFSPNDMYDLFGPSSSSIGIAAIQKINISTGTMDWISPVVSEEDKDGVVIVSSVGVSKEFPDAVFVAGSTTGSGEALGIGGSTAGDWDGFITKIDAETGRALDTIGGGGSRQSHSLRISTQPGRNDIITAMCVYEYYATLVGYTEGKFDSGTKSGGGAFIAHVSLDDMTLDWVREIPGNGVKATSCVDFLIGDRQYMYVAGQTGVGNNLDTLDKNVTSSGGDDIWLAQIRKYTNDLKWIRQIGSSRNDSVVSLVVDKDDNALMFGNSHTVLGEHIENDIFVMSFSAHNGSHAALEFEHDEFIVATPPHHNKHSAGKIFFLFILLPVMLFFGISLTMMRLGILGGGKSTNSQAYPGDEENLKTPPAESFQIPPLVYRDWGTNPPIFRFGGSDEKKVEDDNENGDATLPSTDPSPTKTERTDETAEDAAEESGEETTPAEVAGIMT